jgi:hypothetical protein
VKRSRSRSSRPAARRPVTIASPVDELAAAALVFRLEFTKPQHEGQAVAHTTEQWEALERLDKALAAWLMVASDKRTPAPRS